MGKVKVRKSDLSYHLRKWYIKGLAGVNPINVWLTPDFTKERCDIYPDVFKANRLALTGPRLTSVSLTVSDMGRMTCENPPSVGLVIAAVLMSVFQSFAIIRNNTAVGGGLPSLRVPVNNDKFVK